MIETDRLILRPWLDTDAEALFRYASDPDVGPRAGWPPHKDIEESRRVIRDIFTNDRTWADLKPQRVRLKADRMQTKFFRSLPLHSSQEEVETGEDHAVFQYHLTPDYDFKPDVLSFGTRVEILEPTELRKEFSKMVSKLKEIYGKDV